MKLNRLKILTEFRGLNRGYEVVFNNLPNNERIEPICFVGLNGSGKSNVLEVISECFYYLEAYSEEQSQKELKRYRTNFGFELEFEINPSWQDQNISWDNLQGFSWSGVGNIKIKYLKEPENVPKMILQGQTPIEILNREHFILPNRIIGYSSGMNELISNPFVKVDFFYLEKLREQSRQLDTYRPQLNRMFLMDYEANKIITVCTQIYKRDNNISILNNEINVSDIHSFSIYLKTVKHNYKPLSVPSSIKLIIDKLIKCATTQETLGAGRGLKYKLGFKIDENSRQAFFDNWNTAFDLFRDLYQLRLMNMFLIPDYLIKKARDVEHGKNLAAWLPKTSNVNQIFYMDEICFTGTNKERIIYKHLSDGEHQLLHALSGLMLLEKQNSIFILDEPDTHFNPEWRSRFITLLNEVLKLRLKEQLVFITSHSPFVVSDCKPENVFFFKKNEPAKTAKEIEFNTYGASVDNILKNFFGSKRLISQYSFDKLKQVIETGTVQELREAVEEFGESSEKQFLFRKLYEKTQEENAG